MGEEAFVACEDPVTMFAEPPDLPEDTVDLWALVPARAIAQSHEGIAVSVPENMGEEFIFTYYMPPNSLRLRIFTNRLLEYLKDFGWFDEQSAYWFEGQLPANHQRRWSVIDNVIGWGDDNS